MLNLWKSVYILVLKYVTQLIITPAMAKRNFIRRWEMVIFCKNYGICVLAVIELIYIVEKNINLFLQ